MNSWYKDSLTFFKRYFFIVLAAVVIGNLIAWKNQEKKANYYQSVIKVRARIDYYDLVRVRMEKIAGKILEKKLPGLKNVPLESYRNENFYFIEMKLQFTDTSSAAAVITEATNLLQTDSELKEKYFDQLENYDNLIAESQQMVKEYGNDTDKMELMNKKILFDLKLYANSQTRYKVDLEEKIQIYLPSVHEIVFVESVPSSQRYLSATVLFFIIGLFIAVVIDRFRN